MITAPPTRRPLTASVLAAFRATGVVVGDGDLPQANWIGQPNTPTSTYEPFAVLSELAADNSSGPIGDSQGDWKMPYMVEYFGISRDQVGWLADKLRGTLISMRFTKIALGTTTFKTQYVRTDNLGTPQQVNVTNPSFWHQQDGVTLWMGREAS